jgi:hypothetical protein
LAKTFGGIMKKNFLYSFLFLSLLFGTCSACVIRLQNNTDSVYYVTYQDKETGSAEQQNIPAQTTVTIYPEYLQDLIVMNSYENQVFKRQMTSSGTIVIEGDNLISFEEETGY